MLKEYLQSVQVWIEQGCPRNAPYIVTCGLCRNTYNFFPGDWEAIEKLQRELEDAFCADGLDPDYPFNSSGEDYDNDCFTLSMWENPKRLAWVKKHAETLPSISASLD